MYDDNRKMFLYFASIAVSVILTHTKNRMCGIAGAVLGIVVGTYGIVSTFKDIYKSEDEES